MKTPLRILHVGNFSVRPKQAFFHNTERKLTNGFVRNGHAVLTFCYRDAARGIFQGNNAITKKRTNALFLETVETLQPDLIVLGHAYMLEIDTLRRVREIVPHVRMCYWNVDAISYDAVQKIYCDRLEVLDAIFSTSGGPVLEEMARPDRVVGFMPNPCDASVETARCFDNNKQSTDLFYILSYYRPGERNHFGHEFDILKFEQDIAAKDSSVSCNFWIAKRQGNLCGGPYQTAIANSKMALNISKWNNIPLYSSDRISHLLGNGLLTFVPSETQLDKVLTPEGAAFYDSEEHLLEQVIAYHQDDTRRQKDAETAWRLYHERFNERIVAKYLVEATFGEFDPASVPWPSLVGASNWPDTSG